ncbi:response regulator [Kribbella sp. DT2]|uniref:response regulator n=1 Tax=Kribbella sp. DT2 TaxID=3393427 RepID=UPI003CF19B67
MTRNDSHPGPRPVQPQQAGRQPAIRLLIVDDHDGLREAVRIALDDVPGIEVVGVANDGLQAIETAATTKPDVILMDLEMPRLDGVEATHRILAQQPQIRVIAWTTMAGGHPAQTALTAGAVAVIYKDIDLDALVAAIRSATTRSRWTPPD